MAITQCIECGGNVSTKAEACPHCGYCAEPQAALMICQECGRAFEPSLSSCPACGYPVAIEEGTLKNKADGRIKVPQSFTVLFCFLGVTFLGFLAGPFIRIQLFALYAGAVIVQPWTLVSHSFFPVGGFMGWLNWAIPMVILTALGSYRLSSARQLTALLIGTIVGSLTFVFQSPAAPFAGPGFAVSGFFGCSLVFGIKNWRQLRWYSRTLTILIGLGGVVGVINSIQLEGAPGAVSWAQWAAFWVSVIISALWLVPRPVESLAAEK